MRNVARDGEHMANAAITPIRFCLPTGGCLAAGAAPADPRPRPGWRLAPVAPSSEREPVWTAVSRTVIGVKNAEIGRTCFIDLRGGRQRCCLRACDRPPAAADRDSVNRHTAGIGVDQSVERFENSCARVPWKNGGRVGWRTGRGSGRSLYGSGRRQGCAFRQIIALAARRRISSSLLWRAQRPTCHFGPEISRSLFR